MSPLFSSLADAVLNQLHEGVAVFDTDGRLLYANPEARAAIERMDGGDGDDRRLLSALARHGARIMALRAAGRRVGQAVYLPSAPTRERSTLAERERQAILDTLQATGWKLTESAQRLGISRTTLWRRLKAYGLRRGRSR